MEHKNDREITRTVLIPYEYPCVEAVDWEGQKGSSVMTRGSNLSSLGLGKCNDKIGLLIMISELRLYAY